MNGLNTHCPYCGHELNNADERGIVSTFKAPASTRLVCNVGLCKVSAEQNGWTVTAIAKRPTVLCPEWD